MAIPAVKIWLMIWVPASKFSVQPLNIKPSQGALFQCPRKEKSNILRQIIMVIIPAEFITMFLCQSNRGLVFGLRFEE